MPCRTPPSTLHTPSPRRPQLHGANALEHLPFTSASRSPRGAAARLLPPVQIAEHRSQSPSPSTSSLPPCGPSKRRRGFHHTFLRNTPRQRHCPQSDCFFTANRGGPAIFDQLPWLMHESPAPPMSPWDYVDFSYMPVEKKRSVESNGAGPIRRRKVSLRLEPFPSDTFATPELSASPFDSPESPVSPLPTPPLMCDELLQTPPARAAVFSDDIQFRHFTPLHPSTVDGEVEGLLWLDNPSSK